MPLLTFLQTFTASGSWTAPDFLAGPPAVYVWGPPGTAATGTAGTGAGGAGAGGLGGEPALGGVTAGTVLTVTISAVGSATASTVTGGSVTVTGNAGGNASIGTGGTAGAASSNTVTFAGGSGGNGAAGGSGGGGGGGGSPGSTGAGGNGSAGSGTSGGAGGTAGTGAAGLAGTTGGNGGTASNGSPGAAPASGGGGGSGGATHTGGTSGTSQAVIIWSVWVPPQPVLSRRYPARAVWAGPAHPGAAPVFPGQIQSSGSLIIRRVPGSAVWGGYAVSGGGAAILPGQIQSSGLLIIRRITNTGGMWGGYAAISNIPAAPPAGPPPVIPTSGGTTSPWIRTWRAIAPGDVPEAGAELPKIHGRGYVGAAPGHVEDVIHEPTPVAGPSITDLAADAAIAAARQLDEIKTTALDIGRIFADPPYQPKLAKRCGAIRKVGGAMLTCGRKPGHMGKHSDRGLDWR